MTDIERGRNKDIYLSGQKRTSFEQRSGLPSLKAASKLKRLFTLSDSRKVEAEHIVISADQVESLTAVHEMNPRNQNALDDHAVRDILEQIRLRGVDTEGVAIKRDNKFALIEGSRRRYCCLKAKADLPLWVLPDDLTTEDINALINASQSSKKFSFREVGKQYQEKMKALGFNTNEELGQHLGVSVESIRKRIQAALIDERFISIFPDSEGIPNSFYSRIAKIQRLAEKNKLNFDKLCAEVAVETEIGDVSDIERKQRSIMDDLTVALELMTSNTSVKGWETADLISFDNKDKYARVSRSANGRKVKFEFNRLNANLLEEIEQLITERLKDEAASVG
ncbi:ParB family protein [Xenorhabdus bovienii]|uniref:ParB family protein n=1 Tax=Xenorhabdus bovienii TaxID=40576 RepID=UPI0023B3206E|nr:ParB family protein [Xenorhabdus bovienii]MDE9447712.1 peptide transporter [Xenorhabdus bovienii]MDE9536726.1 peptide transporter [Xenorhabdus bovienii]MDE9589756.1 peptide transporter [Xenorhabdus bovienii]